ncbi:MAG: hypothetical protein ACRC9V_16360, partial [Aeromonas sp.]
MVQMQLSGDEAWEMSLLMPKIYPRLFKRKGTTLLARRHFIFAFKLAKVHSDTPSASEHLFI